MCDMFDPAPELQIIEKPNVYQIASDTTALACGAFRAIAYVDVNAGGDLMKFGETMANNRGIPMNLFKTVAEAQAWLTCKQR